LIIRSKELVLPRLLHQKLEGDRGFFKNLIASDDLSLADFFLWGYLKERVYSDPIPKTTDQLKNNIRR
jgi:hypothetical protein